MAKRKALSTTARRELKKKTGNRCHICGGGLGDDWSADHVIPFKRGGECRVANFLPACNLCNRLRWHYSSHKIRKVLRLGVYMFNEIKRKTELGREVDKNYKRRMRVTKRRRK